MWTAMIIKLLNFKSLIKINKFLSRYSLLFFYFWTGAANAQMQNGKFVFHGETVVVAYSTHLFKEVNLTDVEAATGVLLGRAMDQWAVGLVSQVKLVDTLEKMRKEADGATADILALTTPEYLALRHLGSLTPFMTYMLEDRTLDQMLLLTRRDSKVRSIRDLRRCKIAVFSNLDDEMNLPELWLRTIILKSGGKFREQYSPFVYKVQKGSQAVSDVFFGKADAAVVPRLDFEVSTDMNPQIGIQLSVAETSKPMLYSVLCYTRKLTASLAKYQDRDIRSVEDMMCRMNDTESGRHFLGIFRITRFIPYRAEFLRDTEELVRDYEMLTARAERSSR
jgi:hypothetical protein